MIGDSGRRRKHSRRGLSTTSQRRGGIHRHTNTSLFVNMQIIAGRVDHSFNCPDSFLYYKHCQSASITPSPATYQHPAGDSSRHSLPRERKRPGRAELEKSFQRYTAASNPIHLGEGSQTNVAKSKPAVVETVLCAPRNMFSFKPGPVWERSAGLLVTWLLPAILKFKKMPAKTNTQRTAVPPTQNPRASTSSPRTERKEDQDLRSKPSVLTIHRERVNRCESLRGSKTSRPPPLLSLLSVSPIAFCTPNLASTQPWGGCKHQRGVDN